MAKVDNPSDTSSERAQLSTDEESKLDLALKRGFEDTRALDTQTVLQKMLDYRDEIVHAAEVAKAEFDRRFDGSTPQSGNFGIDIINHGYFGYDAWDNIPELTAGETAEWLDNATPDNLDGDGGRDHPLTIGDPAVHLILGVGSYAESPKVSRLRMRLNDQPRPAMSTAQAFRNTDLRVAWFDTPILLQPDDDVFAEVYADADGNDALYPVGVSYLKSKEYRILDPEDMAGTDNDYIVRE